jgi:hypothetical protein
VSHDRLTRLLQADWSGQRLLALACRVLFVWERGYLSIDETVIAKPCANAIEGLAWVFSSRERKPVYGVSLVLLVGTNGTLHHAMRRRLRVAGNLVRTSTLILPATLHDATTWSGARGCCARSRIISRMSALMVLDSRATASANAARSSPGSSASEQRRTSGKTIR